MSFPELEYAAKKRLARRGRFLAYIEAVAPWPALVNAIAPFYPRSGNPGRPPIGLMRLLHIYVVQQCLG